LNKDPINEDFNLETVANQNKTAIEHLFESKPANQQEMKEYERETSIF